MVFPYIYIYTVDVRLMEYLGCYANKFDSNGNVAFKKKAGDFMDKYVSNERVLKIVNVNRKLLQTI